MTKGEFNANCLPEEVALSNEIARLQRVVTSACAARVKSEAAAALRDQQMRLDILRQQRRRKG